MVVLDPYAILFGGLKDWARRNLRRGLLWLTMAGPLAVLIADRIGHLFGICLGH